MEAFAATPYKVEVTNWRPARDVFKAFLDAHPELGLKYSEATFRNFSRIHAPKLIDLDIIRKAGLRQPAIADVERFDKPVFDLLSKAGYTQDIKELMDMKD